jgi:hypothetical protein
MKRNRPSNAYLNAVAASLVAGAVLAAGPLRGDEKTPSPAGAPAASQKDRNACGGPNGCGGKKAGEKPAGPEATDRHACKGQNACKGKGGCKTEKNACKGHNACKGQGGCRTDGKASAAPTAKPA